MKDRYFYGIILGCLAIAAALAWSLREPAEVGHHAPETSVSRH